MARKKTPTIRLNAKAVVSGRLRDIRQELFGEHGGPELARLLGLPARTWYNYETGVTVPAEVLLSFIELTGTNPFWLHSGEGPRFRRNDQSDILSELTPVQLIRRGLEKLEDTPYEVVVLTPESLTDQNLSDFVAVPLVSPTSLSHRLAAAGPAMGHVLAYRQWIPNPLSTVALRLEDEAMNPILPAGSVVAIDRTSTDAASLQGRIVAARPEGDVIIRWLEVSGRHLLFRPNRPGPESPIIPIEVEDPAAAESVIGQVVWSWSRFSRS